jgi:hypothetical protein
MLLLYAASAATVCGLILWRAVRPHAVVLAGGAAVAAVAVLLFPAHAAKHRRTVDAVRFRESLTGQILTERGVSHAVVSMAGTGRGKQNVLVRADLLAGVEGLEATSLQVEYLPGGSLCRGDVTQVQSFAFRGTCRLPGGARRVVSASWQLLEGGSLRGTVESGPVAA